MTRAWNIRLCLLSSLCVLLSVLPTWSGRPAEALASERGAPSGCTHCAPSPREMPASWRPSGSVQKRLRTGPWSGREARDAERGGKGRVELRAPKYGSERVVFLAPGLVDMLAAHVAAHCPDGGWLFTGDASQPPHQNTVGYRWRRTTAAAGVAGLRLHDLRHFYASGLIASGCDVVTVQRALGHASATTTLNTYSHLWPSAEDRTRAAAQALLADSCGLGVDWAGSRSR